MQVKGRLIVFEGGEGTGKSTQSERLARYLDAELTREPGGSALGEWVRRAVLEGSVGDLAPRAELLLLVAARAEHLAERILPALEAGRDVVCDRFSGSTLAYQGYGRGLPLEDVLVASEVATAGLQPDLTILLDLDPATARARRPGRSDRIEAEGDAFHERVSAGFRTLAAADPDGWAIVDGRGSVDGVEARVRAVVAERLGVGTGSKVAPR